MPFCLVFGPEIVGLCDVKVRCDCAHVWLLCTWAVMRVVRSQGCCGVPCNGVALFLRKAFSGSWRSSTGAPSLAWNGVVARQVREMVCKTYGCSGCF